MAKVTPSKPKKKIVMIYLPLALDAKVRAKAAADKRPLSSTFEVILEEYFQEKA